MSNELERAFAALSSDADQARLAPADAVRRHGNRQTAARAVAGAAAVVVLVTGVTFGARMVLAGPGPQLPAPPPPSPSPSVSPPAPPPAVQRSSAPPPPAADPTTPATTPPSSTPSSPASPKIPGAIPARAFVRASDAPGQGAEPERLGAGDHDLPDFCGNDFARRDDLGIRATQLMLYKSAGAPPESTPKSAMYEDIMVFRGDGAAKFMADFRAAVSACPSDEPDTNTSLGPVGAGDESLLVERSSPALTDEGLPAGDGSLHKIYFAAVRVNDAVAFIADTGWESASADRTDTTHLAKRAATRLASWRP
ncbi:hypothetical protein [Actinoplanes sp. NPDC049265]|uniref:hypothetical protein n=1 Tax=Actinoplanes sp. NPDC049265 TaxID=3363902 RepID=UPI0037150BFE